jgi:hypothetical protein
MHTQAMYTILNNLLQLGTAAIITLLQRWMLEISSFEKDMRWLKRQDIYWLFMDAKWYRGLELYHQYNAFRVYYAKGH